MKNLMAAMRILILFRAHCMKIIYINITNCVKKVYFAEKIIGIGRV